MIFSLIYANFVLDLDWMERITIIMLMLMIFIIALFADVPS